MVLITLDEINTQGDEIIRELRTISVESPMRPNLSLMLESVDGLMEVYQRVGPQSDLLQSIQRTQRHFVLGLDGWEVVKNTTKYIDVHRKLLSIPMDHVILGPLRLKEFRNEDIAPHVYERFIRGWGMFPHNDQVLLYLSR